MEFTACSCRNEEWFCVPPFFTALLKPMLIVTLSREEHTLAFCVLFFPHSTCPLILTNFEERISKTRTLSAGYQPFLSICRPSGALGEGVRETVVGHSHKVTGMLTQMGAVILTGSWACVCAPAAELCLCSCWVRWRHLGALCQLAPHLCLDTEPCQQCCSIWVHVFVF